MTRRFRFEPGHVHGERDGVSFFDSAAYPVQYANSVLTVLGYSLVWPDFLKGDAYCWAQWDSGNANGDPRESAISVITIPNQEWGPDVSNPTSGCEIEDVVLGTVPEGVEELLVRFKATRTGSPSQINGNDIPTCFKEGEWTVAASGTHPFEILYPIARLIYVYLAPTSNGDGTKNVYLRMLQSTVKARQSFYRASNDYSKEGWNYGGAHGSVYGFPVSQRDTRGPSTDLTGIGGRYKRTGSNPAATSDNTDYSSTYTVDFEIIPGRSNITPTSGSGGNTAQFAFVDEASSRVNAATHTRTVQLGEADATRKIIVGVAAYNVATAREINSVTINGVAATQVTYKRNTDTYALLAGIYIADVPADTEGDVVVTFSGSVQDSVFVVFAGYHMNSSTPDGTIASQTANSPVNLVTSVGGLALAIGAPRVNFSASADRAYRFYIDPIENQAVFPYSDDATVLLYSRGHQLTDGATLPLQQKILSASATPTPIAERNAWVAASFH